MGRIACSTLAKKPVLPYLHLTLQRAAGKGVVMVPLPRESQPWDTCCVVNPEVKFCQGMLLLSVLRLQWEC